MNTIRWGILATGNIAGSMAQALHHVDGAELVAVGSRSQASADRFGDRWGVPRRYGSYAALADDPDVDVIYIATPHNLHYENMKLCLGAGKHVLCEKPLTLNAVQAAECVALARRQGLFLMEAVWMRFFPAIARVRQWLEEGVIGEVRLVQADFCFHLAFDAGHRLYDPALGGGALLDLGIYPLNFTTQYFGFPQTVQGAAQIGRTGVDELNALTLVYSDGLIAQLASSMVLEKPREALIVGTGGSIKVHDIFFRPDRLTLQRHGHAAETLDVPYAGNGYPHEVEEVHACLRAGRTESPMMPLDDTVRMMRLMDDLRAKWGVVYPDER